MIILLESGFALNMLFNIFQSHHYSEMLCCNVKFIFLQNLIIRSKVCSDVLKENYCIIEVYFVPDQFSVPFCFVCLFFNPLQIGQGRGELDLKIFHRG